MPAMFDAVIHWLQATAQSVPLPLFVAIGGVIEEIIAPIPSPLVATLAGSIASAQGMSIPAVMLIGVVATVGKFCGATVFYILGIVFKELAVPRFGRYVGVSEDDLKRFGAHFNGSRRDVFLLTCIRAIPVMPSTPISLLCGTLNISARTFAFSSLVGFYIREMTFIILGYTGLSAMDQLMSGIDTAETVLKAVVVIATLAILGWLYWKRRSSHPAGWLRFWK